MSATQLAATWWPHPTADHLLLGPPLPSLPSLALCQPPNRLLDEHLARAKDVCSTPALAADAALSSGRSALFRRLAAGWGWGAPQGMAAWSEPDLHLMQEVQS